MGTYPHLLARQPLERLPRRIIAIDTHPYVQPLPSQPGRYRHTLRVCGIVVTDYVKGCPQRRRSASCCTVAGVFREIRSALLDRGTTWLVAHNVSYDLTLAGLWEWVESGAATLTAYVIDDPPTCIHLMIDGRKLVCVDLLNYWRCDLRTMCAAVGVAPPLSDPLTDTDTVATDAAECHALATAHVCDALAAFLYRHLRGGWKSTAAGIAWNAYRSRQWGDRLCVHCDQQAQLLEREAYYGGRVECHRPGRTRENIHVLDINNLYGWCMHHYRHPRRRLHNRVQSATAARVEMESGRCVIARIRLDKANGAYPLRVGGHTVYPGDGFWTTLCQPELQTALAAGIVRELSEGVSYEAGQPYTAYVEHWYGARLEAKENGDKAGAALAKLITSTLFGRLAMGGRSWQPYDGAQPPERYCVWHEKDRDTGQYRTCRSVAGVAQVEEDTGEWAHSCVYAAAFITSYARARMAELRTIAGPENVYYEDTDCLHVNDEGRDRLGMHGLIHPTRLGALKLVETSRGGMYWGTKAYQLDSGRVCAGLRPDAQTIADGVWLQVHKEGVCQLPQSGPRVWVDTQLVRYSLTGG